MTSLLTTLLIGIVTLAAPVTSSSKRPDLIVLQNGKEIECRVLFEDAERVVYKTTGRDKEVARSEVAEVHSIERNMRTFLEQFSAIDPGDVGGLTDLALWAESVDLAAEARNLWIRILLLDGENEQAWTKLGGSKGRQGWKIRVRGRYKTLEELRELRSEWKTAMEIPTAHYLIKTNVDPELALDVAIGVERLHQMYYETVGKAMMLYPFDQVPEVHIYADSEDAPNPPTPGWTCWYQTVGNVVIVLGPDANRYEISKQFVFLLIQNSFWWTVGNRQGVLVGAEWFREGIGSAFAFALQGPARDLELDGGRPYLEWFREQASDPEPLTAKQIVNSGRGAFRGGTAEQQYVRQAYTLCFFLLHGADDKYRQPFVEYLLSAFEGKGAVKHLEDHLGVKIEDLDEEWNAYVRSIAGM
jgi:hypothetical protein